MKESMDSCACGPSRGNTYPGCSDPQAVCGIPEDISTWCDDFGVACTQYAIGPCGPTPSPTPTPTPTPTPSPSPTSTPCPPGSFYPDQNGNCPLYANKINGCCVCQERNTDCSRFGQGQHATGGDYCFWVEHLCDCYNIEGRCAENPRPSPTATPTVAPQPGGGGGGNEGGGGHGIPGCTDYYWVWYVSYDNGETWEPTGEEEYAGCW